MNEWEADRALVAGRVAAVRLRNCYKHDLLREGSSLEKFVENAAREFVGRDYLNYGVVMQAAWNYLEAIANERGYESLSDYWQDKVS